MVSICTSSASCLGHLKIRIGGAVIAGQRVLNKEQKSAATAVVSRAISQIRQDNFIIFWSYSVFLCRYRDPAVPISRTEIYRFPHAVLEVKLSLPEGQQAPAWVQVRSGFRFAVRVTVRVGVRPLRGC